MYLYVSSLLVLNFIYASIYLKLMVGLSSLQIAWIAQIAWISCIENVEPMFLFQYLLCFYKGLCYWIQYFNMFYSFKFLFLFFQSCLFKALSIFHHLDLKFCMICFLITCINVPMFLLSFDNIFLCCILLPTMFLCFPSMLLVLF
jgi:hypothetical protein